MSPSTSNESQPTFNHTKVTVIFVLGGPGAGKGTQCERLAKHYKFCHFSAGDLLRAEQDREGSQYGELIKTYIREGTIVPMQITIELLKNAMTAALSTQGNGWKEGEGRFLIDGFPRKLDQALAFEETVCTSRMMIFFDTSEDIMVERILERRKTSGRSDDNVQSIKKRFETFRNDTLPVLDHYEPLGKMVRISASKTVEEVFEETRDVVQRIFLEFRDIAE